MKVVKNNFYMDDFLKSLGDEESLIKLSLSLISCLKNCGFRLTKWISNSDTVLKNLPPSELSSKYVNLDLNSQLIERALGMTWNVSEDCFVFKPCLKNNVCTKRGILSLVASVFDPLGILTPAILEAKLIIQALWAGNIGWDDEIPVCLAKRWNDWCDRLNEIVNVSLPRWISYDERNKYYIELLIFCDASNAAYGVVAYIKLTNLENKVIKCSFVFAKSRLSPLKEKSLSIPRLELQAAVLAVRIKLTMIEQFEFSFNSVSLYSDSKVTLNCISNTSRKFPPFVMNRLNEIRNNSQVTEWKYIPGSLNPADMCTRYRSFQYLSPSSVWIKGPDFLYQNECENKFEHTPEINESEIFNVNNTKSNVTTPTKFISCIKWNHYSSYFKLLKHIAWILKLKRNYLKSQKKQRS